MKSIIRNVADCVILGLFAIGCALPAFVLWIPHSSSWINLDFSPEGRMLVAVFTVGACVGIWRIRNKKQSVGSTEERPEIGRWLKRSTTDESQSRSD